VVTGLNTGSSNISASLGNIASSVFSLKVDARVLKGGALQGLTPSLTKAVSTFAGSGAASAVNAIGSLAAFYNPYGITTDGSNLFVADSENNLIRKIVLATGEVSTLSGGGAPAKVGRGFHDGSATTALFAEPAGITTDGKYLYVADYGNHRIRKVVISTGEVSTLAGGDPGNADGNGDDAMFSKPTDLTIVDGNLYVTDYGNNKIRKIVIATGEVSTLAGSGATGAADATNGKAATFDRLTGITTNGSSLFVSDFGNHKIREIVINSGLVRTLAGSGAADIVEGSGTGASFSSVNGITTDGANLYVADQAIRKIVIASKAVTTLAGSKDIGSIDSTTGATATFFAPHGITTDGVSVYVSDYGNHKIRKIQ